MVDFKKALSRKRVNNVVAALAELSPSEREEVKHYLGARVFIGEIANELRANIAASIRSLAVGNGEETNNALVEVALMVERGGQ